MFINNMALEQSARRIKRFGAGLPGKLALALGLLPSIAELEQRFGLPWLFAIRGANPASLDVVILAINGETTDKLNLPEKPAQWSRALQIEAVNHLRQAGAAVIVFDLFFEESRAEDSEFAAGIAQANNGVLAKKLVAQSEALQSATALLHQAAQLNAPFVLPREPIRADGYWTFKADDGELATLPVAALQVFARDLMPRLREMMIRLEPALGRDLQAPSQHVTVLRRMFAAQPQLLRRASTVSKLLRAAAHRDHASLPPGDRSSERSGRSRDIQRKSRLHRLSADDMA